MGIEIRLEAPFTELEHHKQSTQLWPVDPLSKWHGIPLVCMKQMPRIAFPGQSRRTESGDPTSVESLGHGLCRNLHHWKRLRPLGEPVHTGKAEKRSL
ncbi:hypothetical protein TNIN_145981 [Trichonephila inaurata madagascariensis]|uniref:Uncharacterized protein n=1 Tax=Trichonephila inaurata madagascariensis TaxID=2747483 RepID=A0A8X6XLU4_9ARAC|nr:hypothetical protein TNIN_145981 [Trichonephila inaurata madagascariensis]